MTTIRSAKAKGTNFETEVVRFLEANGFPARRRARAGSKDNGDVEIGDNKWTIEAKATKSIDIPQYLRELDVEMVNSGAEYGAVWVKRRGKSSAGDGYVIMDGHSFLEILRQIGI
jgi:Holliday junction resolvase